MRQVLLRPLKNYKLTRVREGAPVENGLRGDPADCHHGQPAVLHLAQFEPCLLVGVLGEVQRVHSEVPCKRKITGSAWGSKEVREILVMAVQKMNNVYSTNDHGFSC